MTGRIKLTFTQMTFRNKLSLTIKFQLMKRKAKLDTHYHPRMQEVGAGNRDQHGSHSKHQISLDYILRQKAKNQQPTKTNRKK